MGVGEQMYVCFLPQGKGLEEANANCVVISCRIYKEKHLILS